MASAQFEDESLGAGAHVLVVSGELDMMNAGELRRRATAALHQGRTRIVVDLGGVTHMDSSGLAELLTVHQRAIALGGSLAVVVTSPDMRRTLEVRGVDGLLALAGSRDEARAAIGAS